MEDSNGKDSGKLDEQWYGFDASARISDSAARSMKKRSDASCDASLASGDENVPVANINREAAKTKPSSVQNPPRASAWASAYPVFTAGASLRYTSPRSAFPLDKTCEQLSSEKQRFSPFTSFQSSNSQTELAKETTLNKSTNRHERPLSAPKNCSSFNASSRHGSFRTSSMRIPELPDSVTLPHACDEEPFYAVSDGRLVVPLFHSQSLSRASSETSHSASSDFSSCFTKATESSSSRSLASESTISKKSSVGGRPGSGGNSPFRYLSARMVAEKLVKVLGKEKLCSQLSRPTSPHIGRSNKEDIGAAMNQQWSVPSKATDVNLKSSSTSLGIRFNHAQKTSGSLHTANECWILSKDIDSCVHSANKASCSLAKGIPLDAEPNTGPLQGLQARALAKEKLVAMLDKEIDSWEGRQNNRQHGSVSSAESLTEVAVQDFDALKHEVRKLRREKRDLVLEVAGEIRTRISEQKAASDALRCMKSEMECKVSAVEKDKASLQESFERELQRRGEEWNAKLERIKVEERRLRDRVTEMAEERVELQKVVASYKVKEASWRAQSKDYEYWLSTLKQRAQESEAEVVRQMQAFADTLDKLKATDGELETHAQRNSFLEMENSDMRKEITRLRRVCNDQEMTIEGLWQELDETVNGTFECRSENLLRLQRELLRLAGVEQGLRSEVNAMHAALSGLKQERDSVHEGTPADLVKLNQGLQERVNKLQAKAAALQEDNKQLSFNLRTSVREKRDAERIIRMLQSTQEDEVNHSGDTLKALEMGVDNGSALLSSKDTNENEEKLQWGLKEEEKLRFRVLNSKLQSREAELEQLDEEIADLINSRDSLEIEVDDLHGKLIIANQRIRELERQIDNKEEVIEVLQEDLEKHGKEVNDLQNELPRVRKQRDEMRKEAEDMSREALRLTLELTELRKVAEKLEEDVMLKEGQISILRGSCTISDYLS